jgi:hypothetical protein
VQPTTDPVQSVAARVGVLVFVLARWHSVMIGPEPSDGRSLIAPVTAHMARLSGRLDSAAAGVKTSMRRVSGAYDFVAALTIAGQLHEQTRRKPPGTHIRGFRVDGDVVE